MGAEYMGKPVFADVEEGGLFPALDDDYVVCFLCCLCGSKDGGSVEEGVVVCFPGVYDEGDVDVVFCGKLAERLDGLVQEFKALKALALARVHKLEVVEDDVFDVVDVDCVLHGVEDGVDV